MSGKNPEKPSGKVKGCGPDFFSLKVGVEGWRGWIGIGGFLRARAHIEQRTLYKKAV